MSRILIIEDEEMLRSTMVRGLSKLPEINVVDAGTLEEGLAHIDDEAPQLILSDINLPGRSGVELLGELEKRKVNIPVIYITAFMKTFQTMIPMHANVSVFEKPVGLNELRNIVLSHVKVGHPLAAPAPFSVPDYIQLSGMGRYSISIEVERNGKIAGEIRVLSGEVWSAKLSDQKMEANGKETFSRLAYLPAQRVSCRALIGEPGVRNIRESWESLLMEAARQIDEKKRKTTPEVDLNKVNATKLKETVDEELAALFNDKPLED